MNVTVAAPTQSRFGFTFMPLAVTVGIVDSAGQPEYPIRSAGGTALVHVGPDVPAGLHPITFILAMPGAVTEVIVVTVTVPDSAPRETATARRT